jgi:hypothetical protein
MQTTTQVIFDNWKNLSRLDFDEYMLNQEKTLLREEKEMIKDAWIDGWESYDLDERLEIKMSKFSAERYYSITFESNNLQ